MYTQKRKRSSVDTNMRLRRKLTVTFVSVVV